MPWHRSPSVSWLKRARTTWVPCCRTMRFGKLGASCPRSSAWGNRWGGRTTGESSGLLPELVRSLHIINRDLQSAWRQVLKYPRHRRFNLAPLDNIAHSEGEAPSRDLFRQLRTALRSGGGIAVIDAVPNVARTGLFFRCSFQ